AVGTGSSRSALKWLAAKIAVTLEGKRIVRVHRAGKHIVFDLDGENTKRKESAASLARRGQQAQWIVHLGMTGSLLVCDPAAEIAKHTHLIARLGSGRELLF